MKTKARLQMLNYIINFCTSKNYGDGLNSGGFGDCYFEPKDKPIPGDLVSLQSAPFSEWYLSWYREYVEDNKLGGVHVLESIETGKLCNWSNVSFCVLNRKLVNDHTIWKWTDQQFRFKEKWFRACYKKRNAHTDLPCFPEFKEDQSVTLKIRKRFGLGDDRSKQFSNWKKVLVKDMLEFYDSIPDKI